MIGDALPIERPPTSLSMISTGSSSIYTCSGTDKQGRRWEDDTFHIIPTLSSTSATNPELFVYLMNLYGLTANMPVLHGIFPCIITISPS